MKVEWQLASDVSIRFAWSRQAIEQGRRRTLPHEERVESGDLQGDGEKVSEWN